MRTKEQYEAVQRWASALRSGTYKQVKWWLWSLVAEDGNPVEDEEKARREGPCVEGYCALGVAIALHYPEIPAREWQDQGIIRRYQWDMLPAEVRESLGVSAHICKILAEVNDVGVGFPAIARLIDEWNQETVSPEALQEVSNEG